MILVLVCFAITECLLGSFLSISLLMPSSALSSSLSTATPYLSLSQQAAAQTNPPFNPFAPPASQPTNKSGFLTYQNYTYGFRLQYPSNWIIVNNSVDQQGDPIVKFRSNQTSSTLVVRVFFNSFPTLQQYIPIRLNLLKQLLGVVSTTAPNSTSIAGIPATEIFYYDPRGAPAVMEEFGVQNNNVYLFRYSAFDISKYASEIPTIQSMINSFQIFAPQSSNFPPSQSSSSTLPGPSPYQPQFPSPSPGSRSSLGHG